MAYFGYEPSKVAVSVGQGVITSVELGTDAVNTIDILNDAVTPAKIDDDGTGFQMGTLGLGGAVSGAEKLTVTGTASFSGAITGNLTGNASGTSATVTGASQSAITSVGTLTSLTTSGVVLGADGSTSAPSFSFSSDTNTGVYRVSADTLGITASGNRQVRFFDGDTYFDSRIYAHVGSVGNPSYCFNDDTDTGIYKVASNQIGIATNGTRRIKIDASGETAIEGTLITSGSATFAGTATAPTFRATSTLISADNMFIAGGQFYLGAENGSTDNTWRMYGYTGDFILQSRRSGTWATRFSLDGSDNATFGGTITNAPSTDGAYAMFVNQQHATGWGLRIAGGADSSDNLINAQNGSGTEKFVVKSDGSATFGGAIKQGSSAYLCKTHTTSGDDPATTIVTFTVTINNHSSWFPVIFKVLASGTIANLSGIGHYSGYTRGYSYGGGFNSFSTYGEDKSSDMSVTLSGSSNVATVSVIYDVTGAYWDATARGVVASLEVLSYGGVVSIT